MGTVGFIIGTVIVIVALIYLVIFVLVPMAGVKKKEAAPITKIPLPALNERARIIVEYGIAYFLRKEKIDIRKHPLALHRLYSAALKAEKELTLSDSTVIRLPSLVPEDYGPVNFELTVYKDLLEKKK
ncbi:MAG: Hsp70 family protein [Candidatus Xenobiia bacterium LiM19]